MKRKGLDRYEGRPYLTPRLAERLRRERDRLLEKAHRLDSILKKKIVERK